MLASWMGGSSVAAGEEILNQAGIPSFRFPGHRGARLQLHVAVRLQPAGASTKRRRANGAMDADRIANGASSSSSRPCASRGATMLTEYESKKLLEAYGIPTIADRDRDDRRRSGREGARRSASRWC